ncbi:MAG: hypothetical protein H7066_03645, partial [Cytophagaceae bacterium]|nr:hypothetical protein [Gemmatimonadaceae bacterium]
PHLLKHALTLATAAALVACTDSAPFSPNRTPDASLASHPTTAAAPGPLAILERATVRYKNLDNAIADGFLLLHDCEVRPGEGPVGTVYYHPTRLLDGLVDPASPDALIYEPNIEGRPKLVGIEFAVPYQLAPTPPTFLGNTFQPEDEFGVFALHVWIWRKNPDGMFAESNPRVSCGDDQ